MRSLKLSILVLLMACGSENPVMIDATVSADSFTSDDGYTSVDASKDVWSDFVTSSDDATPTIGQYGAPCVHASDCDNSLCLESENGKTCSKTCQENCPDGTQCVSLGGPDPISVCVSRRLNLCNPCMKNDECNYGQATDNICLSFGDAGSFCTIACNIISDDCPNGYTCTAVTDKKSGKPSNQCLPDTKSCTCSPRAINLAASTSCATTNLLGSCAGTRTCTVNGLTNCSGNVPEQEVCDNIDNNCDGKTDNLDANQFNTQCTNPNEFGTCVGKFIACQDGKPICDALAAKPEACDGIDNDCDGVTDENLCDDGVECTTDACNTDGSCKHTPLSGPSCDDGNICTAKSQCSAGTCTGGSNLNCDDNDLCTTDWCDPFTGCNHKPTSDVNCTDDGIACTNDICKDGKCTHPNRPDGFVCVSDGNVCTDDVCTAGACVHTNNVGICDDGNVCTVNDHCKDGTCSVNNPKNCNDGNGCTQDLCDPATTVGCYSVPSNVPDSTCNDNNKCTLDVCQGGTCKHNPIQGCK